MRNLVTTLLLATPPTLVAAPALAAPDALCLPEAEPTPDWWSPGLTAARREARWDGAEVRELHDGTRTARLRSVFSPTKGKVYVEIRVQGDVSLDDEDAFVFATADAAQTIPELYVEVHPLEDCPDWSDCSGLGVALAPESILFSEGSTTASSITWSDLSFVNPSPDFALHHPWVVTSRVGSTFTWTLSFAMTVPTDGAGEFAARRMYGNAVMYDPGFTSGIYREFPLLCTSASAVTNDCLIYGGASPELPGDLPWYGLPDRWTLVDAGVCGG